MMNEEKLFYYINEPTKKKQRKPLRLLIPAVIVDDLLDELHKTPTGGHLGFNSLYNKVALDYWIPNLYTKVKEYYLKCTI